MTHDEIAELLGAYALDAVAPDERDAVEEHLASCARCRAEVADHREVAALLGNSGSDAPAELWERIAGSLDAAPPRPDLGPLLGLDQARERRRRRLPTAWGVAVAAVAAAVIAVLGVQVRDQDRRIDELQAALANPNRPGYEAAAADPQADHFALASADGSTKVVGVITEDGTAYLDVSALPTLAGDQTYQLWGAAGKDLVSLGVLGTNPKVISFPAGANYRAFALTVEDAPGVVTTEHDPVVTGTLN
jgi:anti-sigma-K factor RskA